MKYVRISTDHGSVYLDKISGCLYVFPPYFPKLTSWINITILLCFFALLSVPFAYQRSLNSTFVIVLLVVITSVMVLCIHFARKEQELFYERLSQAEFTHKPKCDCCRFFRKQMFKNIWLSLITIGLFGFFAASSYWLIKQGDGVTYGKLFCIFCAWPIIIAFLFCFRPLGTLIDYYQYRRKGRKNEI